MQIKFQKTVSNYTAMPFIAVVIILDLGMQMRMCVSEMLYLVFKK